MLVQCWASVADAGPTLKQHWGLLVELARYFDPGLFPCWASVTDVVPSLKQLIAGHTDMVNLHAP